MHFPQTVEYALRAMTVLARLPEGASARARDLAIETGIPAPYLSKVLRRLVLAGLLTSQKGHRGGFEIARAPELIRFAEILDAVGYTAESDSCVFGWGACDASAPCPLHPAWSDLKEVFQEWARRTTLARVMLDRTAGRRAAAGGH